MIGPAGGDRLKGHIGSGGNQNTSDHGAHCCSCEGTVARSALLYLNHHRVSSNFPALRAPSPVAMPRSTHALAILGPTLYSQLTTTRVLVVGAGGIGCELRTYISHQRVLLAHLLSGDTVKNIVLTGFGDITLLDLDTIDLSNLNRQFLFRKKDVKQSKALVSDAILSFVSDFLIFYFT